MPRSPSIATLIALTMASAMTTNMFLPALPLMAADFGVSYATISLAVGGYLAVTAVLSLLIGPLSDRVGRRPVVLGMLAIFAAASAAAAQTTDIWWFLAARFTQGVMVGGFILSPAILRDTRTGDEVASLLAYITACMAAAPLLAPTLGGVVVAEFGWRAVFWLYTGIGATLFVVCLMDVTETRVPVQGTARSDRAALLRVPRFWWLVATLGLSVSCFYGFLVGTPLVADAAFGLSPQWLGVALGSITAGFMVASFTAARITRRVGAARVMVWGRITAVAGLSVGILATWMMPGAPLVFFAATMFIGFGNGLTIPTGNAEAMAIRPESAGMASGIVGASIVGAGAISTTAISAVLPLLPSSTMLVTLLWLLAMAALYCAIRATRDPA